MENLGALALVLALCLAVYASLASLIANWKAKPLLALSAERAVYTVWALLTLASGLLIYALVESDFRLAYVFSTSSRDLPGIYKFTAWWGGQEGSLLLWSWLLSSYAALAVFQNRHKLRRVIPYVICVLMTAEAFFLVLICFVEDPFKVWWLNKQVFTPDDGRGLNPLLQYWAMVIHPPMLYLGYVGFAVPFAFAMGSLAAREPGDEWIKTTRRWTLVTWMFQTSGILLGSGWAYAVLGWGGYWAWDPVENASLLPWLTATAFLHSVMMQEKRGMMKMWNVVLVSATFFLCIFGTMLTRSGVVQSVHAFAQSQLGPYFAWFLAVGIAATICLILSRLDYLKSETALESVLSRESSFLFNNLLLTASCFSVLWGTLFPVLSEAFTNEKISVDKPFFDSVNIPIGLGLLLLTGVGPLIAWRRSSFESLKRSFLWPTVVGIAATVTLAAAGMRHPYALMSLLLCAFVSAAIVIEFIKGAMAIRAKDGSNLLASLAELIHRNTRRYGGYIVHLGVVLMFIGFTGAAFNQEQTAELARSETMRLGRYSLRLRDVSDGRSSNYIWQRASLSVAAEDQQVDALKPERRLYLASEQPSTEVAVRRRLNEDLYVSFTGVSDDGKRVVLHAYVFPLVSWIWIGYLIVLAGTITCLVPSKSRRLRPREEVNVATNRLQVDY
jgi:cytochrome c-type biogenesis protein CcmF